MDWITSYWRYILLFIVLTVGGWYQLNTDKTYFFNNWDSYGYFLTAKDISLFKLPDLSERPPIFPLLISPLVNYGLLSWMPYIGLILGTVGGMVNLWLVDKISSFRFINLFIMVFVWLDYGVLNFRSVLLTESVAPVFIVLMLAANVYWKEHDYKRGWKWVLCLDIITGLLKPLFVILPLIIKLFFSLDSKFRKDLVGSLVWSILIILALPLYNFSSGKGFILSEVGKINTLGLIMKRGYLYHDIIDAPPLVKQAIEIYQSNPEISVVWEYLILIEKKIPGVNKTELIKEINSYFIDKDRLAFWFESNKTIIEAISATREYYAPTRSDLRNNSFYLKMEYYYDQINSYKWRVMWINLFIFGYLWIKKDKKNVVHGLMLIIVWIVVLGAGVMSMSEYYRLRQPVEPILSWLVFFPFLWIVTEIKKIRLTGKN